MPQDLKLGSDDSSSEGWSTIGQLGKETFDNATRLDDIDRGMGWELGFGYWPHRSLGVLIFGTNRNTVHESREEARSLDGIWTMKCKCAKLKMLSEHATRCAASDSLVCATQSFKW
jgi:hypothetical protein